MWDELEPVFGAEAEKSFDNTANDDGAHERSHALRYSDGNGDGEECETDAHDDGEAGADFPDGVELDECADACDNHAVLDERGGESFFNPDDVCKDDNRRNVTYEHGEHVLQAEWNCL